MKQRKINFAAVAPEVLASRLTVKEVAQILNMCVGNVLKLIKANKIKSFKSNNVQFISLNILNKFIESENNLK